MAFQLSRSNQASLLYTRLLESAYHRFLWLSDPDYATLEDREAWEKIRRDALCAHLMQQRQFAAAGRDWQFVPASPREVDQRAAEIMTSLFGGIRRFFQARKNLAEGIFRGSSWAYIEGRRRVWTVDSDQPRIWWVPERLRHVDRRRFRIRPNSFSATEPVKTVWEFFSLHRGDWFALEHPEAFVRSTFDDLEESLGYGRGLMQSMYFYWRALVIAVTQGLQGLERWALGILHLRLDDNRVGSKDRGNDDIVNLAIDELDAMRSRHILVTSKGDELDVHTGGGDGWGIVSGVIDYLTRTLTQLVLGSVRPTGGNTEMGSRAQSETEQNVSEALSHADRYALAEDLDSTLAAQVWRRNLKQIRLLLIQEGHAERPTRPTFELSSPRQEKPSEVIGIVTAALEAGIALKKEEVYERIGFSMPDDNDEVFDSSRGAAPGEEEGEGEGLDLGFSDRMRAFEESLRRNGTAA